MAKSGHKTDFPDQKAITAFLRTLLSEERNQVWLADEARVKYNTLTNWFTEDPPDMSAINLLRLVIAADAVDEFALWLKDFRAEDSPVGETSHMSGARPRQSIPVSARAAERERKRV